ncbi:MAG TPA: diguanylate cyclase [Candidatus Acidoferrales bacterium]|nr:diguanylate cyclase [Candidatus Acidoferrales bacterium]
MTINKQKEKILIAEDDAVSSRLLEAFAEKRGYEVITARNGQEALDLLSSEDAPRLAVLDWMMPGMEGTEVCGRLRQQGCDRPYIYVLLLTARTERADLVQGLQSGADDYVRKPFDPAELEARLRTGQRILELQDNLIAAREELRFRATHDALTGLGTRAVVLESLAREYSRQQREGGAFGVILLDIDHFKQINDKHGHLCGDSVLREIAIATKESLRPYDTVGRYGGEEFLAVVPNADAESSLRIADRIRRAIASRVVSIPGYSLHVTASFGIAASTEVEPMIPNALLHAADEALYRAKRNGRDRSEVAGGLVSAHAGLIPPRDLGKT